MIDASELATVSVALDKATLGVANKVTAAVTRGGIQIERDARQRISGLAHAPAYPHSISSEVKITRGAIEAEVGPDKGRAQGALGNLLEYGSVNNPPHPHLQPALDAEGVKFEAALLALVDLW